MLSLIVLVFLSMTKGYPLPMRRMRKVLGVPVVVERQTSLPADLQAVRPSTEPANTPLLANRPRPQWQMP